MYFLPIDARAFRLSSMNTLPKSSRIYVAGHRGMVGSAVVRRLQSLSYRNLITASRSELDLTDQSAVDTFFQTERPDAVVFAAARVGGIHANSTYPAEFIYDNLAMTTNAVHAAWQSGVTRFLFLGSTCIYPRMAPQPISEDSLLTSPLEPTNEAYAIAKIAGLKLCQFYRQQYGVTFHSAMPTNLYGPGDNYHPDNSHVLPALIRRFHEATEQKRRLCGHLGIRKTTTRIPSCGRSGRRSSPPAESGKPTGSGQHRQRRRNHHPRRRGTDR